MEFWWHIDILINGFEYIRNDAINKHNIGTTQCYFFCVGSDGAVVATSFETTALIIRCNVDLTGRAVGFCPELLSYCITYSVHRFSYRNTWHIKPAKSTAVKYNAFLCLGSAHQLRGRSYRPQTWVPRNTSPDWWAPFLWRCVLRHPWCPTCRAWTAPYSPLKVNSAYQTLIALIALVYLI